MDSKTPLAPQEERAVLDGLSAIHNLGVAHGCDTWP